MKQRLCLARDVYKRQDEGAAPKVVMPDTGTIYLWEYPGSEISYGTLESMEDRKSVV